MSNEELERVAKAVVRMLYIAGVINGDQFVRALDHVEAAVKYIAMGEQPGSDDESGTKL